MDAAGVLIAVVVFVAILLVANLGYWALRSRQDARDRELSRRLGAVVDGATADVFQLQMKDQLVEALGSLGQDLDKLCRQSGEAITVRELLQQSSIAAVVGLLLGVILVKDVGAFLVAIPVGLLPGLILHWKGTTRAKALSEQLPDALDLMARSLQAGHGLSDAMRLCAEEMDLPVALEFGRVYEEHNLGRDMRECLEHLNDRNPSSFDLRIFVSSVLLQRDTGGNLIEILNNISKTIRDRQVFHNKVGALTAEAKFSALILCGLPLCVAGLIRVMRPEYLNPLFDDPLGNRILMTAMTLFGSGILIMYKLAQVED